MENLEYNKIIFGNNYGWPLVSYGHSYHGINAEKELKGQEDFFKKGHEKYNFTEPVYSFVPSVGISQIVKIPNNYHELWRDNFLLATLNGGHLQRIMFSNDFDRVIYIEKIFVNRRIRDLKFSKTSKALILALEDWQEIGILRPILDN